MTEPATVVSPVVLAALERRHLDGFPSGRWRLGPDVHDPARPVLYEITGMSAVSGDLAGAVSAMHQPGHRLVLVWQGTGGRNRVFAGVRRLPEAPSTEDHLAMLLGVLRAHVPGLEAAGPHRLSGTELPGLADAVSGANATAVMTGVPALLQTGGLERLADAAGGRDHVVMVVAEPVPAAELDLLLDRCRELRAEIRRFVTRTVSASRGESTGRAETRQVPELDLPGLPAGLRALAEFVKRTSLTATQKTLARMVSASVARLLTDELGTPGSEQRSEGRSAGTSTTIELTEPHAEASEALLTRVIARLELARSTGSWTTSVYLAADRPSTVDVLTGALRAMWSGGGVEPPRVSTPPDWMTKAAMLSGGTIVNELRHPLGDVFDGLRTCHTSAELAGVLPLPQREIAGVPVRRAAEFSLNPAPAGGEAVVAGSLRDSRGADLGPVALGLETLNRHTFITGMTGYGKSTTARNILLGAHETAGLPFLVIEPVKAEYRELAADPRLAGQLRVYTIGDEDRGIPLRLNPFTPVASVPLQRHIDLLRAVFNAAFPMFPGMPYVLEEAMLAIYADRGWDLRSSANDLLGAQSTPSDRAALTPTLTDLHDKVEEILAQKGYGTEVHQNMGAALRARLRSLMVGVKGRTLDGRGSLAAHELFENPCVIELRNLGDDEEKAFVMALLLALLSEYGEARAQGTRRLRHLTLIEEAHRLLAAPRSSGGADQADSQAKAVRMFSDLLAEMRSYGEGFIVSDQIPTKLVPDVVKNSTVKIVHRLSAPDDRALMGASMNLTDAQRDHLAELPPGHAVLHDDSASAAALIQVPLLEFTSTAAPVREFERSPFWRNGSCVACPDPCRLVGRSLGTTAPDAVDAAIAPVLTAILLGDADTAWRRWTSWREGWNGDRPARYCTVSQSSHRWLGTAFRGRAALLGRAAGPGETLAQDRAGRRVAKLLFAWLDLTALDDDARQMFADTQKALAELFEGHPGSCPAPCLMTPFAGAAPPELRRALAARATQAVSVETRVRNLLAALPCLDELVDPHAYLRCLLTACVPTDIGEVLDALDCRDPDV
ncbi:ATP-binding protein [Lentzea cavernae]|uniref:Helicase HerA central domain-containing protein n=1 Tax=Lentzea cavernae TaxID=2020703 RepID=A0ABQ3MER2_9PSEU|nr:DUF87 domain-containing protein [Lentzea cavernae]GHH42694.1 hypothetical protein GCM10017774_39470 [Lentzea cavernae]